MLGLLAPLRTADPSHQLIAAFAELRAAIEKIDNDCNKAIHAGGVSNAGYDEAIRNIRHFTAVCVDKCGLFTTWWKERFESSLAAVSDARYPRHEPKFKERNMEQSEDEVCWSHCAATRARTLICMQRRTHACTRSFTPRAPKQLALQC
jgi:hypothetical protein